MTSYKEMYRTISRQIALGRPGDPPESTGTAATRLIEKQTEIIAQQIAILRGDS